MPANPPRDVKLVATGFAVTAAGLVLLQVNAIGWRVASGSSVGDAALFQARFLWNAVVQAAVCGFLAIMLLRGPRWARVGAFVLAGLLLLGGLLGFLRDVPLVGIAHAGTLFVSLLVDLIMMVTGASAIALLRRSAARQFFGAQQAEESPAAFPGR